MADLKNPEFSAVGIDINIRAAEMHLLVNDVPVFDPSEPFGGSAEIDTGIRLNGAFRKGRNTLSVMVRMLPDGEYGMEPFFRIDLGYWEFLSFPSSFDGRPMSVRMQVKLVTPEAGGTAVQVMSSNVETQPLMGANEPARVSEDADGWVLYRFDVNVEVDLPEMAWMNGEILQDTPEMRRSLVQAMREVHSAMAVGAGAARPYLEGFTSRNATALGAPADVYYEHSVATIIDDPDSKILPFDVTDAELRLFGNGRLATFVPLPHRFADQENEGWLTTMYLYYWKDGNGQWRVIH